MLWAWMRGMDRNPQKMHALGGAGVEVERGGWQGGRPPLRQHDDWPHGFGLHRDGVGSVTCPISFGRLAAIGPGRMSSEPNSDPPELTKRA